MPQSKSQKTVLSDDGELHLVTDQDDARGPQAAPVFCIHCGSANRAEATYCRSCGREMEDQTVDADIAMGRPGGSAKEKRSTAAAANKPSPMGTNIALEIVTMIVVAFMVLISLLSPAQWLALVVLIAWFMVVAARNGALN